MNLENQECLTFNIRIFISQKFIIFTDKIISQCYPICVPSLKPNKRKPNKIPTLVYFIDN